MPRRATIVALLATLALVGSACGKQADPKIDKEDPLTSFLARADEITTYVFSMTIEGIAAGQTFTMNGDGSADVARKLMQMTVSVGGAGQGFEMEMIVDDETGYILMPRGFPGSDPDRPWIKMDVSQLAQQQVGMFSSNPSDLFDQVKKYAGDMKASGTIQIGSANTTIYKGSFDFDSLLEAQGMTAEQREQARTQVGDLEAIPVTVYVGNDGLIYRMEVEMKSSKISMTQRMDFSDYGKPVTIGVPPESEVTDAGAGGGGSTSATFSCTASSIDEEQADC